MIRFDVAASSDPGRVRQANEDAYWQGDSVFAVADGMGGHLAGEVASSTALEPIARLDGRVFADGHEALRALRAGVVAANEAVATKASDDPNYEGMGTTLTAAMIEGRRLHVAHVGDSRAYLVRGEHFSQLTTDHTLVQHLLDEGQITEEEAASHPKRSVITRAIGVNVEVEVDTLTLDLEDGDQILLCSDGLTGPVEDETIADVLRARRPTHRTVEELVETANDAGGPDNITVLLLRVAHEETAAQATPSKLVVPRPDGPTNRETSDEWAQQLGRLGRGTPTQEGLPTDERPGPSRAQRLTAVAVVVVLLAALGALGGRWLLSRSFYVGVHEDRVAIFRGVPGEFGPIPLSWVEEETALRLSEVPAYQHSNLVEGIPAANLTDARRIVDNQPRRDEEDGTGDDSAATGTRSDTRSDTDPTPSP